MKCEVDIGCFVAATLVATSAGNVPIEQVEPGDQVWSYNVQTNEWELAEVEATQQRDYKGDLVTLRLEVGSGAYQDITCTGGHPFWCHKASRSRSDQHARNFHNMNPN